MEQRMPTFAHAFHMELLPGSSAIYRALHDPVPRSVVEQLQRAGIHDYRIFLDGHHVFGIAHYGDLERMRAALAEDVDANWTSAVTATIASKQLDGSGPLPRSLPQVFHLR
jgi:L-rhamnose mutarotase